ncbi:hypothetical protein BHYA_0225g00090 [Botrytis hyacinthi]|uniref:Uncharacterized protein n=1 Tax=Botrytis hyacinthi TaxID=278943 RepID=A0A4Z1GA55_9HELO|nr:hypothetical protein BHYA_0225g00090 [Botrytis hyacinthi]
MAPSKSSEASAISSIGKLTLDEVLEFLPVAKRKTQEYIDILAKSTASALREEEYARSTIASYEFFSAERQRQHKHLLDYLVRLLDKMIAFRVKAERDMHGLIEESISMEKAYLHQDLGICKPLEFSTQNPIFELHLANMEGITSANLVAELSTLDLAQTFHVILMLQAQIATVALDLVDVRKITCDHEEQGQLCVEYYQRASHKKRQILEQGLRKWLANNERVLVEFKQRQKVLETEFMSSPAILEMVIKHLKGLLDKEVTEQDE